MLVSRATRGAAPPAKTDFEDFESQNRSFVLRLAHRATGTHADAQDLAQEVWLRAFRGYDRFDGRYPRGWLATILRHADVDRARRKREVLTTEQDGVIQMVDAAVAGHSEHDQWVDHAYMDPSLGRAYLALCPDHQDVVHLRDLCGLSYSAVAAALDVPVGTVRSRLNRGRQHLREGFLAGADGPR